MRNVAFMSFPREPKQAGGWTIQYNFLDDVKVSIEKESPEYVPSMEEIEAVLLAVERLTHTLANHSVEGKETK